MRLPKYELFSVVGLINVAIGTYIFKWLISLGFSTPTSMILLSIYFFIVMILFENLKIELEIEVSKDER